MFYKMGREAHFRRGLVGSLIVLLFASGFGLPSIWAQDSTPTLNGESTSTSLASLVVFSQINSENSVLTFEWGEKKPALAVIKSNGQWWIVFDESATVSLPNLKEHPLPGVKRIDTTPTKDGGVALQVIVDPDVTPVVDQANGKWQVSFHNQPFILQHQASIQLPQSYKDGLVVGREAPGKEVRFIDPHTGYTHIVFPSYRIGLGIANEIIFPDIHVLATTQGVGFEVLKDEMVITATPEQVTVTHPDGVAITLPQAREQARTKAMPMGLFVDAQDIDWVDRRQKINEELLDLPHSQHGAGELELAWLLLSHGQAAEALGYLTHLSQERPSIINLPIFQLLQGMGNLLLHRFSKAEKQLASAGEEPEVQIWLSVIKTLQNPLTMDSVSLTQFRTQLQDIKPLLQSYPKPLRNQMTALILMAGIAVKDVETLASILDQETRPENIREGEVFDLARARVLIGQNKPDAALQLLGELMERAASSEVRAIARFDYVTHRWETHMMKREDALLELERVRSQCREGWLGHEITAYLEKREAEKPEVQ